MIDLAARSTEQWLASGGLASAVSQRDATRRAEALESLATMPAGCEEECTAKLPSCAVRESRGRRHAA
jgi:hypothetical protein